MAAAPNLEELFDDSRFVSYNWTLLLLILYTPLGLALFVVRLFLLIQFYLAFIYLPYNPLRRFVLRLFGSVLGVAINEKHLTKLSPAEAAPLWVSNHVSPFDRLVLQVLCCRPIPVTFPECGYTSGKKGLLKFQARVFEQHKRSNPNLHIQPVALDVSRPFPACNVSLLQSTLWNDTFFLLFSPYTSFSVRLLDPTSCREDEELKDYVGRVETAIAESLTITATSFTSKDKEELIKRKVAEEHMAQASVPVRRSTNNLEVMAAQVKEIMPHVPMVTILRDLGRTKSVDATVANLVEGVVPFVAEPVRTSPAPASSSSSASASSTSASPSKPAPSPLASTSPQVQICSSTFGKSAQERGLSLQQRKQRLLQEARRRYCEKHGLNLADLH